MWMPRVRFTVRRLMVAVGVLALAQFDARLATALLLGAGAVVAVWSLFAKTTRGQPCSWAGPYLVTLACLYLPFAWVLGNTPWDSYRWHWIQLWPVLPGLVAGLFVHPNDSAMVLVSGATSILLVLLITTLGTLGRKALVVVNGIALVGAGLESWLAYQLFRW